MGCLKLLLFLPKMLDLRMALSLLYEPVGLFIIV